jgi:hypothetical protein
MRFLVLVVHDGWTWLSSLAETRCGDIRALRSDVLEPVGEDYKAVVIRAQKVLSADEFADILGLVGLCKGDEAIVFAHRAHRAGCSAENVHVAGERVGCAVEAMNFSADASTRYPCQLCDSLEEFLTEHWGEWRGFAFPSWGKIKAARAQEGVRVELQGLVHEFRCLRHKAGHIVFPVDIDLQGVSEAGFAAEYWADIKNAWGHPEHPEPLAELKRLVFEEADKGRSLSALLEQCREAFRGRPELSVTAETVEQAWKTARSLLPRGHAAMEPSKFFIEASRVVRQVREIDSATDQRLSELDPRAFSKWLRLWNKTLDEIEGGLRILHESESRDELSRESVQDLRARDSGNTGAA